MRFPALDAGTSQICFKFWLVHWILGDHFNWSNKKTWGLTWRQSIPHFWVNPSLCSHWYENDFLLFSCNSPFARSLVLKVRAFGTWKWFIEKSSRYHFTIGLALRCGWETSTTCNDMSLRWLDIDMKRNDSTTKRLFLVTWWWNCSWISLACSCCRIMSSTFLSSEQQKVKFQYWRRLDEHF